MPATPNLKRRPLGAFIVIVALIAGSALAHHGWSNYDAEQTLDMTGVILESSYSHPHGIISLRVGGEDGKVWTCVLAPPSRMKSRGLPDTALTKGNTARVVGYPHREKSDELRAERITIDGKTVELR